MWQDAANARWKRVSQQALNETTIEPKKTGATTNLLFDHANFRFRSGFRFRRKRKVFPSFDFLFLLLHLLGDRHAAHKRFRSRSEKTKFLDQQLWRLMQIWKLKQFEKWSKLHVFGLSFQSCTYILFVSQIQISDNSNSTSRYSQMNYLFLFLFSYTSSNLNVA